MHPPVFQAEVLYGGARDFYALSSSMHFPPVHYSLFTFGESILPYFLVCGNQEGTDPLSVRRGDVRINRPMILTAENSQPEFENFFECIVELLGRRDRRFCKLIASNLHRLNMGYSNDFE